MKRGNNGKLSVAQCRHLLYLPPHYSQRVRVEDQNISSSLCRPGASRRAGLGLCQGGQGAGEGHAQGRAQGWTVCPSGALLRLPHGTAPGVERLRNSRLLHKENVIFKAVHGKGMADHSPTRPA